MHSSRAFFLLLTALTGLFSIAQAGPTITPIQPITVLTPGLQMSLVTSVSRFVIPPDAPVNPAAKRFVIVALPKKSFAASVSLTNFGRTPVQLSYPGDVAAGPFKFSLLNAAGDVVWTSGAPLTENASRAVEPEPVPFTLAPRATVRRTIQIPLKTTEDQWLPAGRYTVRAETGQGEALSQMPIDIVASEATTGIQGRVLFLDQPFSFVNGQTTADSSGNTQATTQNSVITIGNPIPIVVRVTVPIQATIYISEIRDPNTNYDHPPFEWSGKTDLQGNYRVPTPPGRFHLSAHADNVIEPNYFAPNWLTVTVTQGQFTNQSIVIVGAIRKQPSLISNVGSVTVEPLGDPVSSLRIKAKGEVTSSGWTEPQLIQRESTQPGVLELDFVAVRPSGISLPVISPIEASADISSPGGLATVRVRGANNSVTIFQVTPAQ